MRGRWLPALAWLLLGAGCATASSPGGERFVARLALEGGFTCVVAEGDLEPRSIGTYSVRVYRNLDVGDYVAGIVARRDGFVRRAYAAGTDGSGRQQIAVQLETAGSGRYMTTDVFVLDAGVPSLRTRDAK